MMSLRGNRDVSLVLLGANSLGVLLAAQEHLWGPAALCLAAQVCLLLTLRRTRRREVVTISTRGWQDEESMNKAATEIEQALARLKRRRGGRPLDFED